MIMQLLWWFFFCICNYHVVTNHRKTNHINNKTKADDGCCSRHIERRISYLFWMFCVGQNLSKENEKDPLVFIFQVVSLNTTQSTTMMMRASPNLWGKIRTNPQPTLSLVTKLALIWILSNFFTKTNIIFLHLFPQLIISPVV